MVSAVMLAASVVAAPSPIDDEAFLLFLADTLETEQEGEQQVVDPLSMAASISIEQVDTSSNTPTQEDEHEQ